MPSSRTRSRAAPGLDADATGIIARPDTDHPARPDEATSAPVQPETYRQDDYQDAYGSTYKQGY